MRAPKTLDFECHAVDFVSVEFAQLELLEDLRGGEDAGVDDAGHGEGPAHNGADRREEVVEGRSVFVVAHSDRVHVVPKQMTGRYVRRYTVPVGGIRVADHKSGSTSFPRVLSLPTGT